MYKLASHVLSYKLDETVGFPFQFQYYGSDTKGSCIAPEDLSGNVSALQRYLFGTQNYQPTQNVQRISQDITAETGFAANGTVQLPSEKTGE